MFSCQNLSKKNLFDKVSISVNPGQIVFLIGSNGSGKTSLFNNLAMLDQADSGSIVVDNLGFLFPINFNPNIYPKITMVSQGELLYPHLNVQNNIFLAAPTKQSKFDELIDYFGIRSLLIRFPHELSGEQKQIITLVRLLILEPKYLLLDEVTSALDSNRIKLVCKYLKSLKSKNVGIILISHSMMLVKKLADKIYFFDSGKIVEFGDISILDKPVTNKLKNYIEFNL